LGLLKSGAGKLIRVELQYGFPVGLMLDIYIATPETWATLLLIRTGSKEHNIRLCSLAKQKGMYLKADGQGLFKANNPNPIKEDPGWERIAGDTELSIFEALGLPYKRPEERI
jgi:DNA polymerase (family 10)